MSAEKGHLRTKQVHQFYLDINLVLQPSVCTVCVCVCVCVCMRVLYVPLYAVCVVWLAANEIQQPISWLTSSNFRGLCPFYQASRLTSNTSPIASPHIFSFPSLFCCASLQTRHVWEVVKVNPTAISLPFLRNKTNRFCEVQKVYWIFIQRLCMCKRDSSLAAGSHKNCPVTTTDRFGAPSELWTSRHSSRRVGYPPGRYCLKTNK